MNRSIHRQRGMTLIGWVMTLVVIGFFALFVIRLTPIYLHYQAISSIMDEVANDPQATSLVAVRDTLSRRLDINELDDLVNARDFKVTRDSEGTKLSIQYQERTGFLANIDLVVSFDKTVTLTTSR